MYLQDDELDQLDEDFSDIGDFDNTNMLGFNDTLDQLGSGHTTDSQDQVGQGMFYKQNFKP